MVRIRATGPRRGRADPARVLAAVAAAGRDPRDVRVLVDVYLIVGPDRASAQARLDMLADLEGVSWDTGSLAFVGTSTGFAELVTDWLDADVGRRVHGPARRRCRPTCSPSSTASCCRCCARRTPSASATPARTLRDTLGLPASPAARYAATGPA